MRVVRTTRRQVRKRVPVQEGKGFTTVDDGFEDVTYEALIDESGLDSMGRIAASNKGQRSRDGCVIVRVLKRVKVVQ